MKTTEPVLPAVRAEVLSRDLHDVGPSRRRSAREEEGLVLNMEPHSQRIMRETVKYCANLR